MTAQRESVADVMDVIFGEGTAEKAWSGKDLEEARKPYSYTPPPHCHHVLIKVTGSGRACLQHPQAELGNHNGVRTIMITGVPHGAAAAEVLRRYNASVDTWADVAYCYDELGTGRVLR